MLLVTISGAPSFSRGRLLTHVRTSCEEIESVSFPDATDYADHQKNKFRAEHEFEIRDDLSKWIRPLFPCVPRMLTSSTSHPWISGQ